MTKAMTPYEQRAWQKLIAAEQTHRNSLRVRVTDKVSSGVATAMSAAGKVVNRIPGGEVVAESIDAALSTALNGAAKAIFIPAIMSVSVDRRTKRLRKQFPEVGEASPFEVLDLQILDKGRPRQIIPIANAAASAGASLAITGAEVSATVSGGATAGVVVLAIAGDIGVSLGLLGRSIAEVAVHYGFDTNEPGEDLYLMGVLSYSTAASLEGKTVALAALSRLTQQMMRNATWNQLSKDAMVRVIQSVFTKIGIKLTHKRLAQIVPVLGGLISAGLSYDMQHRALQDATRIYRARYLAEKHGLSFDEWIDGAKAADATDFNADEPTDDEPIDVEAEVEHVLEEEQKSLGSGAPGSPAP